MREILEGEYFYNLMQAYRFAPVEDQWAVVNAYEAVQKFILEAQPKWKIQVLLDGNVISSKELP